LLILRDSCSAYNANVVSFHNEALFLLAPLYAKALPISYLLTSVQSGLGDSDREPYLLGSLGPE
jgi:hypothetical protein